MAELMFLRPADGVMHLVMISPPPPSDVRTTWFCSEAHPWWEKVRFHFRIGDVTATMVN